MHLVTVEPVGRAELPDLCLDLLLQCLQPGELVHPPRQSLQALNDQRTWRGVTLRGGDSGVTVDLITREAVITCPQASASSLRDRVSVPSPGPRPASMRAQATLHPTSRRSRLTSDRGASN